MNVHVDDNGVVHCMATPVWLPYKRVGRMFGAYFYAESADSRFARCIYARGTIDNDEHWTSTKRATDVRSELIDTVDGPVEVWESEELEPHAIQTAKLPQLWSCMLNGKPGLLTEFGRLDIIYHLSPTEILRLAF